MPNYTLILALSLIMPLSMVLAVTPSAIKIAHFKGLVAKVKNRSSHSKPTPIVGGIPIMIAILFSSLILMPNTMWEQTQFILAALLVVFMVGFRDDVKDLRPGLKMAGQIIAITILVSKGGVRLDSMYGLAGTHWSFPDWLSILISGFTLLVVSNAFNLIDGINGLAGTVGTIACCTFGVWFFIVGEIWLGLLAMATAGSLLGFLAFNMATAKTFMGDSGSLVVGLMMGVLAVKFIDVAASAPVPPAYAIANPVAVCVGILVIPLFDTIRVFVTRIARGQSPFAADKRHIHHMLIASGFSHLESTAMLGLTNLLIISLVLTLDTMLGVHGIIAATLSVALGLTFLLHRNVRRINARRRALGDFSGVKTEP